MIASARATPAEESLESNSDSDAYAISRRAAISKRRKRLQNDGTLAPPPQRFSERRAAKVANYNEDDDGFSDDEEMATPNGWAWAADATTSGIDLVMDAKPKDGLGNRTPLGPPRMDQPRLITHSPEENGSLTKFDYTYWVRVKF